MHLYKEYEYRESRETQREQRTLRSRDAETHVDIVEGVKWWRSWLVQFYNLNYVFLMCAAVLLLCCCAVVLYS